MVLDTWSRRRGIGMSLGLGVKEGWTEERIRCLGFRYSCRVGQ